nr:PAS domain S-box protein [Haloprofundus salilacus]
MSDLGDITEDDYLSDPYFVEGIVETNPVGIAVVDADGTVSFANERAEEIYGRSRQEISDFSHDDPRWDLVDREGDPLADGEAPFDYVVAEEKEIHNQVLGLRRPSGERVWLSVNGAPQWSEDGELAGAVFAFEDITEQRQREQELQKKERRYQAVFEDPNILVGLLEPNGTVIDINQTAMEYVDLDLEDVTGEPFWETPWWGNDDGIQSEVREWIERAASGDYVDFEADLTQPTGENYTVSGYFRPVIDDGEVVSIIVSDRDITEQKERERALRDAKAQLEAATEAAAVGTWEWHVQEDMMVMGPSFATRFGIDPDDAREGISLDRYVSAIHEDDRERVEAMVDEALASCGEYEEEYRVWNDEGELRWVVARGRVECDEDGNPLTFPGAVTDITERKEYQHKLEESNERLEQFAYAASHDLQEPLRMVSSYLQLLEHRYGDELDEDGQEFIEFAVDGAGRMREMIEGLLQYSRVDSRGNPFEPVDLDAVFANVRQDLQVKIEETGAEITAEDLPRVYGDLSQLNQLFQNLLDNAIEYSGDAPPRIHVAVERDGTDWVISVEDEGIGIPREDADRVFRVFQSLQGHEDAGTGIGLALCKRIVERHGGEIWIDSVPGEGATFSFILPAAGEADE